ncbi:MerR family transcriptional regulator [Glutamicibacter sp. MNS18]|uniref:transcriptional regulator FtsR n=1 Tax=Glutamicibacter sp. MNS18 TaxID=2989817 RepID=UPI00353196A4
MFDAVRSPRLEAARHEPTRAAALNIGEVLSELKPEFPRVTASKIRFLEDKGLIIPQRTSAGYRKYTPADVNRLRFILAVQRDQYLPLKVIKDHLDAVDRGDAPDSLPGGAPNAPQLVDTRMGEQAEKHSRPVSQAELQGMTGAGPELISQLENFGLIEPEAGLYDENCIQVTKSAVSLASHGVEPRHLRQFRLAAEREFALIESIVGADAKRPDIAARARAAEEAREIGEQCLQLHDALVQRAISQLDR